MRAAPFWINKHGTVPPSATVSLLCSCFLPFSVFGISPVLALHKTVPLCMLGWQLQEGTTLYLQCQLGEEDAEGASHRRRAGISSLIRTAGMRRQERGLQVWLDYIYKLWRESKEREERKREGDRESLNTERKRRDGGRELKTERERV